MNPECDQLQELYEAYALGLLSDQESERLEQHLRDRCPNCMAGVRAAREEGVALALAAPQQEPPARIKQQLMARVAPPGRAPQTRAAARSQAASAWKPLAIAAVVALMVTVSAGIWHISDLQDQLGRQRGVNQTLQQQIDLQQETLAQQKKVFVYLNDATTSLIALKAVSQEARYGAHAVWSERGLWLMAGELPAPAADKTYQLWAITKDQKKISAGIFRTDPNGEVLYQVTAPLPARNQTQLLAVTLEPAGGMPQPTGGIILASAPISTP